MYRSLFSFVISANNSLYCTQKKYSGKDDRMMVFSTDIHWKKSFLSTMYKLCFCSQKECQKCIFRQSRDTNFIFSPFAIHLRNTSWRHWIKQAVKKVNLWKGTAVEKSAWRKAWKCINYIKYINVMISLKI